MKWGKDMARQTINVDESLKELDASTAPILNEEQYSAFHASITDYLSKPHDVIVPKRGSGWKPDRQSQSMRKKAKESQGGRELGCVLLVPVDDCKGA